jgi:uncharacterized protein (TIGR02246 family)
MLLLAAAPDQKADLRAIDDLHRRDIAANKAYDVEALAALWTDDVVTMPPGMAPIVGKKANRDLLEANEVQAKQIDILGYEQQWEEIRVLGDYAYEWGIFRSTAKLKAAPTSDPIKSEFRVMRVLKRQPDGGWKVHRSIWNSAPPPEPPKPQGLPSGPVILPPPPKKP